VGLGPWRFKSSSRHHLLAVDSNSYNSLSLIPLLFVWAKSHIKSYKVLRAVALCTQFQHYNIHATDHRGLCMKNSAKRPAFTPTEIKLVITALRTYEKTGRKQRTTEIRQLLRDYVHFVILTGCRPGTELINLRYTDIDTFYKDGRTYYAITVNGKTGERELVAGNRLRRYLNRLKDRNVSDSEYVFVLSDGTTPKDLHGAFELLLKTIDLLRDKRGKRYSLYSLRHSFATRKLLEGVPMHLLARQMGTSTSMIESHYSKVTARMAANLFN